MFRIVIALSLACLMASTGASTRESERRDATRRSLQHLPWRDAVNATANTHQQRAFRSTGGANYGDVLTGSDRELKKLSYPGENNALLRGLMRTRSTEDNAVLRELMATRTTGNDEENNSLLDVMRTAGAGEGKEKRKNKGDSDEDDEDRKTLSQQIADGKYGLIEKEIYSRPPLRPGIISYKTNPEVPKDTIKNLGGLDAEEIWLAEDHVLVLRGGWFPNHNFNRTEVGAIWPPIDDYNAPPRQVKIPSRPKVPPPFPIQLRDGGPTHFIGPNGTRSQHPFPPPFFPFPPGDGFYPPPPGNGSLYPPPLYPYPAGQNGSSYPPDNSLYPYPPEGPQNGYQPSFPQQPPPHGYMPFPNGTSPFGPLPPFFPNLPPGAAFLPPPGNQTEFDEDDPSIYYPPPYDFYYPRDNSTQVPPGPLVPGIILPPPPNFFAPLNEDKPRGSQRPTSTPLPHVPLHPTSVRPNVPHRTPLPHIPFNNYPTTNAPHKSNRTPPSRIPFGVYPPTASVSNNPNTTPLPPYRDNLPPVTPPPIYYPHSTRLTTTPPPLYYPVPREPDSVTRPPGTTPYGTYLPGPRPTVKRPYLTYVPVTTAQRKKKPRPTTAPKDQYEYVDTESPPENLPRPRPPTFVVPQNVQVFHKGESPITVRPYYYDDVGPSTEDNSITSTPRPNYISEDSLSKLKDILYTTPLPSNSYPLDALTDIDISKNTPQRSQEVTTVEVVKSIEYTTESPYKYPQTDLTKRPIYVQDIGNYPSVNYQQSDVDSNSVHPTHQTYNKNVATTPAPPPQQYYQPQPPSRTPKTTYYFYDEPHYEQGSYLGGVTTAKPYVYDPPQYQNVRPSQRPNYKTQEELLLAQIAATLRQPGTGYFFNSPNKQSQLGPTYYQGRDQYYPNQRPTYGNTSPRPGFYITKKPEVYSTQTERPYSYKYNQAPVTPTRNFPYSFEDTYQSTEHPLPKQYNTTPRPPFHRYVTPHRATNNVVQTSPKTVYEYSYQQKQADTSTNYVHTERPKTRMPKLQQSTEQYYEDYSQNVTPDTNNNHIYPTTTVSPVVRKYPVSQQATPDPLQHFYTPQDDTVIDDITKKYFTIFGQKLPAKSGAPTTPLPPVKSLRYPCSRPVVPRDNKNYQVVRATEIPLYDDVAVNYRAPRPPINPDSEFINPELYDDREGGGKLISYKLPGNEGGHFYFLTPQVVKRPQQQQQQQQHQQQQRGEFEEEYRYPVPERGLRTRRNKSKQR